MSALKDNLYNYIVRKNENVRQEYERYVMEHIEEHYEHKYLHWKILWKLNLHYRIQKKDTPMLYFDPPAVPCLPGKDTVPCRSKALKPQPRRPSKGETMTMAYSVYKGEAIRLTVTNVQENQVSLSWNRVPGICAYRIEKAVGKEAGFRPDGKTDSLCFNAKKLNGNQRYFFRVQGILYNGQKTPFSNTAAATTLYSVNRKEANPYLDGAESALSNRRTVHFLAKELLAYDIISFDIFDTMILRPFAQPRDLFMLLDDRFQMLGFASIRQRAENTARSKAQAMKKNREVTIWDIYEEIERMTGIPKEYGAEAEFHLEYDLCFANPYMLRLFNLLKHAGKRIILVSDMYFPSSMLEKLLEKCGYHGYEELFVSCEHNSNKYSGTLFSDVMNKKGRELRYFHIGDSLTADIRPAKKLGIDTYHYVSCGDIGNRYRASQYGMLELTGSAYSGIVNAVLHNGLNQFTVFYEYGFLYGGLYVYGFCQWIHRYAKEHRIHKILFLARDGYIYKKVYDMLFSDIPSEYVLWSRIANSAICADWNRDIFLKRNIDVKVNYELKSTIGDFISLFGLEGLEPELKHYGLHAYSYITAQNVELVRQWITDSWSEVTAILNKNEELYREYFGSILGGGKNVIAVDTGWQGTTLLGFQWLIEKKWKMDCRVHCLMAASQTANPIVNQTQLMSEQIKVYLFSSNYNRNEYLFHKKKYQNNLTSFLFEMFTQAQHPTFCGLEKQDDETSFRFGIPEVENYQAIQEIHDGIYDFCEKYHKVFGKYEVMNYISGHDAYTPFRFIAKNPRLFLREFMDVAYSKSTGGDEKNQKIETMRELFEVQKG